MAEVNKKMANYTKVDEGKANYQLLEDGTFVIENYNLARPFSSFFPGIAGLNGIPMWAFYVNRNQCIASFGVNNKNYSITEFYPANNSYALVSNFGFRTFVKIKKDNGITFYEPFRNNAEHPSHRIKQKMFIRAHELALEEINESLGLKISVRYFTLPQEPMAALVRIVEFENISNEYLNLEVIDGLPKIIPYWMSADILKAMSYTAQAWTTVTNFEKTGIPFYKLKVEISDVPEVTELKKGNFYFGLVDSKKGLQQSKVVIDPEIIFGEDTSLSYPRPFMSQLEFKIPLKQKGSNKYPSAMSFISMRLSPRTKQTLYSVTGHIGSEEKLNEYFQKIKKDGYFNNKIQENKRIIDDITRSVHTESNLKEFDLYCRQTYLDNLLRGGMPIILPAGNKNLVYYVYSRKHGDLERDYNFFQLSPSYYSQGNGNFRDMNQNKRSDIFFNPKIADYNVMSFYNLIQLDGYNPLVLKGSSFFFNKSGRREQEILGNLVEKKHIEPLKKLLSKYPDPGSLLFNIEESGIKLKVPVEKFLNQILSSCERVDEAEHGEGFWTDHWTYNLDLLESYLSVYPEKAKEILFEKKEFTFYDNSHVVLPREEKYVEAKGKIRQFGSVGKNQQKEKMIWSRQGNFHTVRVNDGEGEIYKTTLAAKIICLIVNKLATLDPEGIGIEMEAEKPSWYDALNGLPGVFGSSVPETFELKRLIQYMKQGLNSFGSGSEQRISVPEEIYQFFAGLLKLLKIKDKISAYEFWDRSSGLKEKYRKFTIFGVTGREKSITFAQLDDFLKRALEKIDSGLAKARDKKSNLFYTYFSFEPVQFRSNNKFNHKGLPCVKVLKFKKRPLALFLEAQVHYMKTEKNPQKIERLHRRLKSSQLYDKNLKMYKVNAPLKNEPTDIGRCTVFSPGWLENESIWLHMEYKYLLELLKAGLYDDFFVEFKKAGICFQDPKSYGRSILENSSFIVSSAFPDQNLWGRGYVARLSGSTAEFIQMWLILTAGAKPFKIDANNELALEFKPSLPGDFFTKQNTFTFMFLGKTIVKYFNPKRLDTYSGSAAIKKMNILWYDGGTDKIAGKTIKGDSAARVRNQEAKQIEVFF